MAEPTQAEVPALLLELKNYVMGGPVTNLVERIPSSSWIATEGFLASALKKIDDIHQEVVNPVKVELLQQARMDTLAAAVKKVTEGNPLAWAYFASAVIGIAVPLVAAALLLKMGGWVGTLTTKLLNAVQDKYRSVRGLPAIDRNAGNALNGPTPEQVEALRLALEEATPSIAAFNEQVKKLPLAKELTARAKAVERLSKAAQGQNDTKVTSAATAIRALKTALKNFNQANMPRDHAELGKTATAVGRLATALGRLSNEGVEATATAIGHLKTAFHNFTPTTVRDTASATRTLGAETRTLTNRFADLRAEAGRLANVVG
ncbi:hypothetical protein [Streptomyces sp. NPDC056883]|uniref:hypothetical protein n=1 Tax=Streptomyces sp. NPDC056883 TaxID=3345959 RepID=UPI0036BA4263